MDDNQWEPDEEFFVKLTLIPGEDSENVKLGKICIMEITILNDDGRFQCIFLQSIFKSLEYNTLLETAKTHCYTIFFRTR